MIYVIGDVHLRSEEPFYSVTKSFLQNILDQTNSGDSIIFTGDFFHRSRPYSEELMLARKFFEDAKNDLVKIHILAGNHEYFREHDAWAEDVFKEYDIDFIDEPQIKAIDGVKFLFLPWVPMLRLRKLYGFQSMRDFYESKFKEMAENNIYEDFEKIFVIYHFEDETVFMGSENIGVDLRNISKCFNCEVVRIGGHIHNPTDNYIGSPYATRADETNKDRSYLKIHRSGLCGKVHIDPMIEFKTINFQDLKEIKALPKDINYIIKVLNAPSIEAITDEIKGHTNIWLDDYELKFNEDREIIKDKEETFNSIREFLDMYIKQNKVDSDTANYLLSIF